MGWQSARFGDIVNPKSSWMRFLLGTAMGGFLMAATSASADVPKSTAPVQGNAAEARKLLAEAQAAIKAGNLRLALITLKNAAQAAPANTDVRIQLGLVLFQTGDQAGGEREVRQAWKAGAPETTVLPYLFKIMLSRGEYQELVDQFPDPGTANTPNTPNLLKARAFALQRLGRGPEAVDAADRVLKLEQDGPALLARANLSLQQGDLKSAGKFADEAIKRAPADVEIAIFKLSVLKASKDNAGALAFGDQMLAKFPGVVDAQYAHIELLLDQKQYAKAKAEIDAMLAKKPELKMPVYYKALLASRTGDARAAWDIAVTLPKEFVELAPNAGLMIAQMAVNAGHKDAAADTLGRVLGKDTDNLVARRRLAALYLDQNNAKSALNLLAPVEGSTDPETVRLLSRVYTALKRKDDAQTVLKRLGANSDHAFLELRAGDTEQAITELKEVSAREPGNVAVAQPLVTALLGARRFAEALEVADRLAADPKQRTTALVFRGNILMAQRNLPEAKIAFDKAVALEPKNQAVQLARADFFIAIQKYPDAARDLQAVLASDPKNAAARVKLADIATKQGKEQEARKLLGEAIAQSPQDAAPRLALIRRLVAGKDLKGALKAADDVVGMQPSNPEAVTLRGQIQSLLDQKQQAVESFRRLVSLTPSDAQAQLLLANALFDTGDRAGTLSALDAAADISPQSPAVARAQTDLQFAFGNADTAVSKAQAFQASYPGSEADILLADTLTKAKRYDQASDVLTKSLAGKPDQAVLSRLVQLKILAKDKKAASSLMSQWLARNPGDVAVRHNFAMVLMSDNDAAGARAQYEAILKQNANDVLAMNNLGGLLQSSDPSRASNLLTKAVQLAPNSPDVNDSLGWLKVQQKDAPGGLAYLKRAHDLNPQDPSITYHLIVALDSNAKRNDARTLLKSLLASGTAFPDKQAALKLSSEWR
jgi:putative PEP-CTERM system TPR-repeat lipoprotein